MKKTFSRRNFLQLTALGTGSILLLPQCSNRSSSSKWLFFTNEEADLVESIIEQIIPTDDWPGAREAGVAHFIDKQLRGPYLRFQEKYRVGLDAVQLTCNELYSKDFQQLTTEEQVQFLKKMETGELTFSQKDGKQNSLSAGEFFSLIRDHTMQGFYGSPRHGGNKDYVS
ncbi:MAG: gluconate 2-dehydrogenase subunit 3 family protein [Bacteroidales bacterium]|nr:gluconate 2-dehydrogenase subunit 3 family protein [Bacteroidales bacterium]